MKWKSGRRPITRYGVSTVGKYGQGVKVGDPTGMRGWRAPESVKVFTREEIEAYERSLRERND